MATLTSRRRSSRWAKAVAVAALCGATASLAACSTEREFSSSPERSSEGKELYWFETTAHMAKASNLVVRGKVTATSIGRTYGDEPEAQITTRYVDLSVQDVLRGPATVSTVRLEEEGYDADKVGVVVNGVQWSKVGDEGYYFVTKSNDGDVYRLVNSYGRVLYSGQEIKPSGHNPFNEGPWVGAKYKTKAELDAVVRDAVRNADKVSETAPSGSGGK